MEAPFEKFVVQFSGNSGEFRVVVSSPERVKNAIGPTTQDAVVIYARDAYLFIESAIQAALERAREGNP